MRLEATSNRFFLGLDLSVFLPRLQLGLGSFLSIDLIHCYSPRRPILGSAYLQSLSSWWADGGLLMTRPTWRPSSAVQHLRKILSSIILTSRHQPRLQLTPLHRWLDVATAKSTKSAQPNNQTNARPASQEQS